MYMKHTLCESLVCFISILNRNRQATMSSFRRGGFGGYGGGGGGGYGRGRHRGFSDRPPRDYFDEDQDNDDDDDDDGDRGPRQADPPGGGGGGGDGGGDDEVDPLDAFMEGRVTSFVP